MPTKKPATPRTLALEGDLDVFSIHAQWELLQPLAQGGAPLSLDFSGVADLDLSGLQLLATLRRDLAAKGQPLVVVGAQEEWSKRFAVLGLADLFEEKAL